MPSNKDCQWRAEGIKIDIARHESLRQYSWVPETPTKPSPLRPQQVYIRRQSRNYPSESFLSRVLQGNFHFKVSTVPSYEKKDDQRNQEKDVQEPTISHMVNDSCLLHHVERAQKNHMNKRQNDVMDFNERAQKKPRKRKHRPKVVVEGTPIQIPEPKTPKPVTPKHASLKKNLCEEIEKSKCGRKRSRKPESDQRKKRKYVRKSSQKASATAEMSESAEKPSMQVLEVDIEDHLGNEQATVDTHQVKASQLNETQAIENHHDIKGRKDLPRIDVQRLEACSNHEIGKTKSCTKVVLNEEEMDSFGTENNDNVKQLTYLDSHDAVNQDIESDGDVHGRHCKAGTLILYPGSVATAKNHNQPKVDLDSETLRTWKLLITKDNSACEDKTDEEKKNWWKEEREVFCGRALAFTSQIYEILGDRRFKPWKGSVVDSVVGVFLTQNVFDHRSSSAYMSLGAKFPVLSEVDHEKGYQNFGTTERQCSIGSTITSAEPTYDSEGNRYFVSEPDETKLDVNGHLENITVSLFKTEGKTDESKEHCCVAVLQKEGSNQASILNMIDSLKEVSKMPKSERVDHERITFLVDSINSAITNEKELPPKDEQEMMVIGKCCLNPENSSQADDVMGKNCQTYNREKGGKTINFHSQNMLTKDLAYDVANTKKQRCGARKVKTKGQKYFSDMACGKIKTYSRRNQKKVKKKHAEPFDWDSLRRMYDTGRPRGSDQADSVDWEAVRCAALSEVAEAIKSRGQQTVIAKRIKDFLDRVVALHGSIDLEWLRNVPPDDAKRYLLEIYGLGLKSVECVRLLTLHHIAFPVDTNIARIAVRLGWVPLQPLPEELLIHLLEQYPAMNSVQKYLWPRLCNLDHQTLYELHYQMITFGKVFCTKKKPNCNSCPMRGECKHFASAFASARLALPEPSDKRIETSTMVVAVQNPAIIVKPAPISLLEAVHIPKFEHQCYNCSPIVQEPLEPRCDESPATAESVCAKSMECDIEDFFKDDYNEIPSIKLNFEEPVTNLRYSIDEHQTIVRDSDTSTALVALSPEVASIPVRKLKNVSRLRTEHQVYQLPDEHPLLEGLERRDPEDPSPYLLAIWRPGETADSVEPPQKRCRKKSGFCNDHTCFSCCCRREQNSNTIRGTILIPCRTEMRASFPLNGTYFQVNEVFADHETSLNPITIPRKWIWNLEKRTVYFGTSISSVTRGLSSSEIQYSFWKARMSLSKMLAARIKEGIFWRALRLHHG
ncbi:protein ROS1A-like isoform X2 [Tripterygium wilfordii]|uniref:protein ROS1A-like isoform X2 n=1 Tax=Tripterygium wilfordii TaxID=458696 RepID=UPI0018F8019B|nr:protein ROS1A-like isoform X2 [Tripterygium wilfordii]